MRSLLFFSLFGLLSCAKAGAPSHGIAYPGTSGGAGSARPGPPLVTDHFYPLDAGKTPPAEPRPSALSFGDAPFGAVGWFLLERAARDASWVALCQARSDSNADGKLSVSVGPRGELSGDAVARYLITPNEELGIDDLLLTDRSDRYAIILQQGAAILWDSVSRTSTDLSALGADARLSAESFAAVRTFDFDADSRRLLYVRAPGEPTQRLVIRTLADGSELELDPGPVPIWRARFGPGSAFISLEVMSEDTNKNGKLGFPAPLLTAPRACNAGPGRYQVFAERGDKPLRELLPVTGGAPLSDPDLVMPIGDGWLLRDSTGALLDVHGGKRRLLEPAACRGRIVHADAARDLYIVGCAQKKTGRMSLEQISRGERKALGVDLASVELDREPNGSPRLLPLYPGTESALFDTERRELLPLQPGDFVLAVRNTRALVRRGKALVMYDAETRKERALPGTIDRFPELLVRDAYVFISPLLVSLDASTAVELKGVRPLALSEDGRVLVGKSASGPLQWLGAH